MKVQEDMPLHRMSREVCRFFDLISFIELINDEIKDYNLKKLKDKMLGKKYIGINRNKYVQFQTAKLSGVKRKNRFKSISK